MSNESKACTHHIQVSISGPGGLISEEVKIIENTFRELGYKLEIKTNFVDHEYDKMLASLTEDEKVKRKETLFNLAQKTLITLNVNNQAWGG